MVQKIELLQGGKHTDDRGTLFFVNDFDMEQVKRMYIISHSNVLIRRGWRGHKLEQRWFCVTHGSFEVNLVKIDNWDKPNPNLDIDTYVLLADEPQVLHVPNGYATSIRAIVPDAKIVIFADTAIENSGDDDYLFSLDYFKICK